MKVLIVDDDLNTVQLIEDTIPWENYEVSEVFTAYHGEMAMEVIQKEHPDIVISDIEMPQMDGLKMLEIMADTLEIMPEVIFLTCHDTFSFAQKAIKYGVNAYLLKPFRKEELAAVLSTSVAKCSRRQEEQQIREKLYKSESLRDKNQDYLIRTFIQELIYRDIVGNSDELEKIVTNRGIQFDVREKYYLVLAGMNQRNIEKQQLTESELHFVVKNVISEVISDQTDARNVLDYTRGPYYLLILFVREDYCNRKNLEARCERLIHVADQYIHVKLSCVFSEPEQPERFADTFQQMYDLFEQEGGMKASVIWSGQEERSDTLQDSPIPAEIFLEKIQSRKKVELIVKARDILQNIEREGRLDGRMMHTIHHDIMQIFYGYLNENGIHAYRLFQDQTSRIMNNQAEYSTMDMIKYISYLYDCTVKQIDELQKSNSFIATVKKYIDKHYMERIGRDEIAASVFIAPGYLSKRFREETGQSLREYINIRRIEEAKRLMRTTQLSLTDIALQVGFDNIPYFSTVFKKYCKVSPSEWKDGIS